MKISVKLNNPAESFTLGLAVMQAELEDENNPEETENVTIAIIGLLIIDIGIIW